MLGGGKRGHPRGPESRPGRPRCSGLAHSGPGAARASLMLALELSLKQGPPRLERSFLPQSRRWRRRVDQHEAAKHGRSKPRNQCWIDFLRSTRAGPDFVSCFWTRRGRRYLTAIHDPGHGGDGRSEPMKLDVDWSQDPPVSDRDQRYDLVRGRDRDPGRDRDVHRREFDARQPHRSLSDRVDGVVYDVGTFRVVLF